VPRLTTIPFPCTRFIPGSRTSGPRPVHAPALSPEWSADPAAWRDSLDYLWGIDLFNAGFTWESHEALETPWKQLRARGSPECVRAAHALQAIIQTAAARIKHELGNTVGVRRLIERSSEHVALAVVNAPTAQVMGVDLARWHEAAKAWFTEPHGAFPILDPSKPCVPAQGQH
jgi:hypothetical protein